MAFSRVLQSTDYGRRIMEEAWSSAPEIVGVSMDYETIIGRELGLLCTEICVESLDSFDGIRDNDSEFVYSISSCSRFARSDACLVKCVDVP